MAYIRAIANGNYSSASTWNGGVVPGAGDIACCGSYRVTLDVSNVTATLSTTNVDWVAAGGTALSITHTGGWTHVAGSTLTINHLRWSTYRSSTSLSTADIQLYDGTVTVQGGTQVSDTNTNATKVLWLNNTAGTLNLTVGDILTLGSGTWATNAFFIYASASILAVNLTTGLYEPSDKYGNVAAFIYIGTSVSTMNWVCGTVLMRGYSTTYSSAAVYCSLNLTFTVSQVGYPEHRTNSSSGYPLSVTRLNSISFPSGTFTIYGGDVSGCYFGLYLGTNLSTLNVTFDSLVCDGAGVLLLTDGMNLNVIGDTYVTMRSTSSRLLGFLTVGYNSTMTLHNTYLYGLVQSSTSNPCISPPAGVASFGDVIITGAISCWISFSYSATTNLEFTSPLYFDSIDASAATLTSSTQVYITPITPYGAGQSRPIHIYGDVKAPVSSSVGVVPTAGMIAYNSGAAGVTNTTGTVTIEGTCYPGVIPIFYTAYTFTPKVTIGGLDCTNYYGCVAFYSVMGYSVTELDILSLLRCPDNHALCIRMPFALRDTTKLWLPVEAGTVWKYIKSDVGTIPAVSDVREGVAVGSGVGTLVVPSAATVLDGIVYDGNTTGTLAIPSADIAAIKAQTDQLQFDVDGNVLASGTSGGSGTDYTARFDTIDAAQTTAQNSLNAANTAIAVIKSKTDQLTFTSGLVNANTPATDYTARFDTLETMVGYIPTVNYTARLNTIDVTLDTIYGAVTAGGTDLTPVTTQLDTMQATLNTVYNKAVQFTFTANGVVADAEVSVNQAINYDTRFDTIDAGIAGIRAKTDDLTFDTVGVIASATVDLAGYEDRFTALDKAVGRLMERDDLVLRLDAIDSALATISNATGAVDLEPISAALTSIYTSVQAIPRLTYGGDFAVVNAKLDAIPTEQATVDLTEVTDGIASLQVSVAELPTTVYTSTLNTILAKLNTLLDNQNDVDFTEVLAAIESSRVLIAQVKSLVQSDSTDLTPVMTALDELLAKFAGVDAPVTVIPAGSAGTTTLYGYCYQANGVVLAGEEVTCAVTTACGTGKFVLPTTQTSTSDATGLVTFQVPRHDGLVVSISYGGNTEEVIITGLATQEMPAIVKS